MKMTFKKFILNIIIGGGLEVVTYPSFLNILTTIKYKARYSFAHFNRSTCLHTKRRGSTPRLFSLIKVQHYRHNAVYFLFNLTKFTMSSVIILNNNHILSTFGSTQKGVITFASTIRCLVRLQVVKAAVVI